VVTCNPPYIPLEAWESVAPEARDHDPALALWSGRDGLDALRLLERRAALLLRPGGVLGAEHADQQGVSAPAVFTASGRWTDVRDHRDLAGRPRFVTARLAT
jgi:release factor glutamine methyltransferase